MCNHNLIAKLAYSNFLAELKIYLTSSLLQVVMVKFISLSVSSSIAFLYTFSCFVFFIGNSCVFVSITYLPFNIILFILFISFSIYIILYFFKFVK